MLPSKYPFSAIVTSVLHKLGLSNFQPIFLEMLHRKMKKNSW